MTEQSNPRFGMVEIHGDLGKFTFTNARVAELDGRIMVRCDDGTSADFPSHRVGVVMMMPKGMT